MAVDSDVELTGALARIRIRRVEAQHIVVTGLRIDLLEGGDEVVGIDHRESTRLLGHVTERARGLLDVGAPLALVSKGTEIDHALQATRVDSVDTGVDAIGGQHQLAHQLVQVHVGIDGTPAEVRVVLIHQIQQRITESPALHPVAAPPALGERIEIVSGTDEDDGLAPVVDALDVVQQVIRRVERHLRAGAKVARALRRFHHLEDFGGNRSRATDLTNGLHHGLLVIRRTDADVRRAAGHQGHQIAVVDQCVANGLDQAAHMGAEFGFKMQVVDEDQEYSSGGLDHRGARRWQDDAFRGRGRPGRWCEQVERAPALNHRKRHNLLGLPVFEHGKILARQVGHEAALRVARDHIGRDQSHSGPERGLLGTRH